MPADPQPPRRAAPLRRAALLAGMPCAVALLAVAAASTRPLGLDALAAPAGVHGIEPLVEVAFAITGLGGSDAGLALTAIGVVALAFARLWRAAIALPLAVFATQLVVDLIKHAVERPRPHANAWLAEAGGWSFPSGHSATSAALFGTLALVALRHAPLALRAPAVVVALGLAAAVGASRVVLGAHYPTDVVGGWLTGATIALAATWALRWRSRPV